MRKCNANKFIPETFGQSFRFFLIDFFKTLNDFHNSITRFHYLASHLLEREYVVEYVGTLPLHKQWAGEHFHFPGIEFWTRKQRSKLHSKQGTMVNRPPASFINERPPFRAATAPRRNLPRRRTQRTRLVAARWSWAARGLSSGRFAVTGTCFCTVWGRILEIPRQSTG